MVTEIREFIVFQEKEKDMGTITENISSSCKSSGYIAVSVVWDYNFNAPFREMITKNWPKLNCEKEDFVWKHKLAKPDFKKLINGTKPSISNY